MRITCADQTGPVWRLRLERGEGGRLAIGQSGLEDLERLVMAAAATPTCRVVVLESQPGTFCQGMDLRFATTATPEEAADGVQRFADCLQRLRGLGCAVVGLVDGATLGGGVGLVAACDLVIATEGATFALPEVTIGLIPAIVLPVLRDRVGLRKACGLAMSGRTLSAAEAAQVGLVDEVVPDAEALDKALRRLVKQLLRSSPRSVGRLKQFAARIEGLGTIEALEESAAWTRDDVLRPETREAIAGFLAGQPPPWFDRWKPGQGS